MQTPSLLVIVRESNGNYSFSYNFSLLNYMEWQ